MAKHTDTQPKICLHCKKILAGRTDKRFCDAHCRNSYHNRTHKKGEGRIRRINSILRKNRTILKTLNPIGKTTVRKEHLVLQQFDFRYFTHIYQSKAGNLYRFCYEYGYMPIDDEKVVIITWQSYMNRYFQNTAL